MGVLLEWLRLGGPSMVVLALMSVLGLTLVIVKLWDFSERRFGARDFLAPAFAAWERGQAENAIAALSSSPSPLAAVLSQAIATLGDTTLSDAQARERIERNALEQIQSARTHLRTLDLIASLAPLLGLLGTVMGMLQVFDAMAMSKGGDTRAMADGISHAMIATMAGLVVSVIGLFFSNLFASRVRVETERLNDLIAPG